MACTGCEPMTPSEARGSCHVVSDGAQLRQRPAVRPDDGSLHGTRQLLVPYGVNDP